MDKREVVDGREGRLSGFVTNISRYPSAFTFISVPSWYAFLVVLITVAYTLALERGILTN